MSQTEESEAQEYNCFECEETYRCLDKLRQHQQLCVLKLAPKATPPVVAQPQNQKLVNVPVPVVPARPILVKNGSKPPPTQTIPISNIDNFKTPPAPVRYHCNQCSKHYSAKKTLKVHMRMIHTVIDKPAVIRPAGKQCVVSGRVVTMTTAVDKRKAIAVVRNVTTAHQRHHMASALKPTNVTKANLLVCNIPPCRHKVFGKTELYEQHRIAVHGKKRGQ